ncbi:ROK family protein [Arundinibacter roseus]|uniref:ROK family protein n=1 Tax=Arundinibacter roseus TaxID=2070510 RepID=A0A4R4KKG5_9BACT|nr:ROK family protein [Arundinibacter roseus]TDB67442.1 ROK family protein [Arundinibacter roseus]
MKKLAIGIDIGGTRTKGGLVDLNDGRVIEKFIFPTETTDVARFEQSLHAAIDNLRKKADNIQLPIVGIGVGVSGFVWEDGRVDTTFGFMDFLDDYPLADILTKTHALNCLIDNDARLVALGEAVFGNGKAYDRVLVLTLGTGLGVGFVTKKRLTEKLPFGHMAGHIKISDATDRCYCGKMGCLESLVSASGIIQAAHRLQWFEKYPDVPLRADSLFDAQAEGNLLAGQVVEAFLNNLKSGISNYVNIYAPEIVILGGGLAGSLQKFLPDLQSAVQLGPTKNYTYQLQISKLHELAGILGSAALFL